MMDTRTAETGINGKADSLWQLLADTDSMARWLSADKVIQLDEGELGRGSRLSADFHGRTRVYHVTYWEPLHALSLQYRGSRIQFSLRFDLIPEQTPERISVRIVNQASGFWHWPTAVFVWREQRRIVKEITRLEQCKES